jgi:hypothetical protein
LIVIEQVLDVTVFARAQSAHVHHRRVYVLDVEEILGVVGEALRARLARVHVRVETGERVFDVVDARLETGLFGAFLTHEWTVHAQLNVLVLT